MLDEIFSINSFDILKDDEYYYLFRALNLDDIKDIENEITTSNNKIIKVRTDSEKYGDKSKYKDAKKITLEEAFDHIKNNHRKDTKCISLSTNANVSILYGRGYYKDKYIVVKVKKDSKKVVNAGLFLLKEVEKQIKKYKTKDELIKYYLTLIDNIRSKNKLLEIKKMILKSKTLNKYTNDTLVYYNDLNNEQNLAKDKILLKLMVIDKNIIKNVSNIELIRAINNAFTSLEFIHYNTIRKSEIISLSKEMMDAISIVQQIESSKKVEKLKSELLKNIDRKTNEFKYDNYHIESDHLIETMYEVTKGKYSYKDAYSVYKNSFYLAKSLLRRDNAIEIVKSITKNKKSYKEIYESLENTFAVEPDIFSNQNETKLKISDKVEFNLQPEEIELVNYILKLDKEELINIVENPIRCLPNTLKKMNYLKQKEISKENYYNDAIIDIYNENHDKKIKNVKVSCLEEYEKYKDKLTDKDIAKLIISTTVEKKKIKISGKLYTKKKEN